MALSLCNVKVSEDGRELVEHGTLQFPVACYHDDLIKEDVYWHWHDELELIFVSEGSATIAVEQEKFTACQGDGFFINTGILHAAWHLDTPSCRFQSIVFHPRMVGGSMDSVFWQNYIQPLTDDAARKYVHIDTSFKFHHEAVTAIKTAWQACVTEPPGYEFEVRNCLSRLIFILSSLQPAKVVPLSEKMLRENERIKIMLQFIQDHFYEPISIAMIAGASTISESECLRCFHNTIGISPIQYLKQFRIQKAADFLISSNKKISDIGIECGFHDSSYFTKSFRETKGITPTEYRRNHSHR